MILWTNATFHTLETETSTVKQILTDQGKIIAFDDDVYQHDIRETIDLKGTHVYPGFVDAHLHLIGYGRKLTRHNLENSFNKKAVLRTIQSLFKDEPLFVEGYHDLGITKNELDLITTDYPIMIRHNDYHSLTVNSYVLRQINRLDSNGILLESESQPAIDAWPPFTKEQLKKMLHQAISSLYQYGITGGHSDDLAYFNDFEETLAIINETVLEMPFRAHLLVHHQTLDDYVQAKKTFLDQHQYLQLGAVKIFYDGTFSSQSALLKTDYPNTNQHGQRVQTKAQMIQLIKKIRSLDLPVAIHTIGDLALNEVMDLLEEHPPKTGLHDRIIHASLVDQYAYQRLAKLPVVLDVQPQFITSDFPWMLPYVHQDSKAYPFRTLLKHGITLAGSSDAPVEAPNPLLGMHAAITRQSAHNRKTYYPEERLSRFEALQLYTKGANVPTYHHNRGLLEIGYIADFSIFKKDLLQMHLSNYKNKLIYATVINEKIVYSSP